MKLKEIFYAVIACVCVVGLVYLLNKQFPYILNKKDNYMAIVQLLLILAVVGMGIFRKRISGSFALTSLASWLCIALVLVAGYSYQAELKGVFYRIKGNLLPSSGIQTSSNTMTFYKDNGGHFLINATINRQVVQFLLDTGASKIMLTQADAIRVGIDVAKLKYDTRISTANGVAYAAFVTIPRIEIGTIYVTDIEAYISSPEAHTDISLLGMNFLTKLKKYEIYDNTLKFHSLRSRYTQSTACHASYITLDF